MLGVRVKETNMEIRIIQWREFGDDDDTMTTRVVESGDDSGDKDYVCRLHGVNPALSFDDGGVTIISCVTINTGEFVDDDGQSVQVTLTKET